MMSGPVPQTPQPPSAAYLLLAELLPASLWDRPPPVTGTRITVSTGGPAPRSRACVDVPSMLVGSVIAQLLVTPGVLTVSAVDF